MMFLKHMDPWDISSTNLSDISPKCYSGLTFLELYILLVSGLTTCGILTLFLTAITAYHFDNVFAPFAIGILFLSLPITFYSRFIYKALNEYDYKKMLTTKYEPFIFIALLIIVTAAAVIIEIRKKKRAEI